MTDIVGILLGPAQLLTKGLVGLIMGLGIYALEIWLMYQIVVMVPPRVKSLVEAIDYDLSQMSWHHTTTRQRVYKGLLQVLIPAILIAACYLAFSLFTAVLLDQVFPLLEGLQI